MHKYVAGEEEKKNGEIFAFMETNEQVEIESFALLNT